MATQARSGSNGRTKVLAASLLLFSCDGGHIDVDRADGAQGDAGGGPGGGGQGGSGGGGSGGGDPGADASGGSGGGGGSKDAGAEVASAACDGLDGGSGIKTAMAMFDYLNQMRRDYASHPAWDGYPFIGKDASRTWTLTQAWDADLAGKAQGEAERLAAGGGPKGREFRHQDSGVHPSLPQESMWLSGLETPEYMLEAASDPAVPDSGVAMAHLKWQSYGNGMLRMAVGYQTGSAPANHKRNLGVGKACTAAGKVWWVAIYGE